MHTQGRAAACASLQRMTVFLISPATRGTIRGARKPPEGIADAMIVEHVLEWNLRHSPEVVDHLVVPHFHRDCLALRL
jgi:hypothetical protein